MNQQKAVQSDEVKKRKLFGNWELQDELDDAELMTVVGGVRVSPRIGDEKWGND